MEEDTPLIALARNKASENPTDLELRFALGKRLHEAARFEESLGELRLAKQNPKRRKEALGLLAIAFEKTGRREEAERIVRQIADESFEEDD